MKTFTMSENAKAILASLIASGIDPAKAVDAALALDAKLGPAKKTKEEREAESKARFEAALPLPPALRDAIIADGNNPQIPAVNKAGKPYKAMKSILAFTLYGYYKRGAEMRASAKSIESLCKLYGVKSSLSSK